MRPGETAEPDTYFATGSNALTGDAYRDRFTALGGDACTRHGRRLPGPIHGAWRRRMHQPRATHASPKRKAKGPAIATKTGPSLIAEEGLDPSKARTS